MSCVSEQFVLSTDMIFHKLFNNSYSEKQVASGFRVYKKFLKKNPVWTVMFSEPPQELNCWLVLQLCIYAFEKLLSGFMQWLSLYCISTSNM